MTIPICWSYHGRGRLIVEGSKVTTIRGRVLGCWFRIDTHHLLTWPAVILNRREGFFLHVPVLSVDIRPLPRARVEA